MREIYILYNCSLYGSKALLRSCVDLNVDHYDPNSVEWTSASNHPLKKLCFCETKLLTTFGCLNTNCCFYWWNCFRWVGPYSLLKLLKTFVSRLHFVRLEHHRKAGLKKQIITFIAERRDGVKALRISTVNSLLVSRLERRYFRTDRSRLYFYKQRFLKFIFKLSSVTGSWLISPLAAPTHCACARPLETTAVAAEGRAARSGF